jgi:hypothetical protein
MGSATGQRRWLAAVVVLSTALVAGLGLCGWQTVRLNANQRETSELRTRLQTIHQQEQEAARTRREFVAALERIGPIPLPAGVRTTYDHHRETMPFDVGFPESENITGGGTGADLDLTQTTLPVDPQQRLNAIVDAVANHIIRQTGAEHRRATSGSPSSTFGYGSVCLWFPGGYIIVACGYDMRCHPQTGKPVVNLERAWLSVYTDRKVWPHRIEER